MKEQLSVLVNYKNLTHQAIYLRNSNKTITKMTACDDA
jgi:hypothetical protein